jgi:hypothetical protein
MEGTQGVVSPFSAPYYWSDPKISHAGSDGKAQAAGTTY